MSFSHNLKTAWQAFWSTPAKSFPESDDGEVLSLRRDLATVLLELQEAREALAAQQRRLKVLEEEQAVLIEARLHVHLEALFRQLAAPLSQLGLQGNLLESGVNLAPADIMTLVRQVIQGVEEAGLEPISAPNTMMNFDPETAQPLAGDVLLIPGQVVRVKFSGYRYRGCVIRKALVEKER